MPIAEIIAEIDAYLSRLRQARELLLDTKAESPQKRITLNKEKITNRQARPYTSKRRIVESNPRSNHAIAQRGVKRVDTDIHVHAPDAVDQHTSVSEQPVVAQPERTTEHTIVVTKVPARRRFSSIKTKRSRAAEPEPGTKPDALKPAIALAGPSNTKIVVVSAEQMQREREQARHSEVQRPRTPASGLSGRRAFEALFRD